jgi:hypothetical protein
MLTAMMSIDNTLLVFSSFAISSVLGVGIFALAGRRHQMRTTAFIRQAFVVPPRVGLHGVNDVLSIEDAEHQLGLVYQRMRAYLRDPYDFARSRIKDDAGFEHSLDFAVSLNLRISDLGGEAVIGGEEVHEQVRQQILEGLVNRVNLRQPRSPLSNPSHSFRDRLRA